MTTHQEQSLVPAGPAPTPPPETPNRYDPTLAGSLANRLLQRDISPGDLANLRRMDPHRPSVSLFWNLMFRYRITQRDSAADDSAQVEQAWAHLLAAVAQGTRAGQEEHTGPHDPARPMGAALAAAGYHQARLDNLLNADDSQVQQLAAHAAGFLHSRGESYNCADLARLMLTPLRSQPQRDADRTYLARHYHREIYRQSQTGE